METKQRNISGFQLGALLFISRYFSYMTYLPQNRTTLTGPTALMSVLVAVAILTVAFQGYRIMCKRCGPDLFQAAHRVSPAFEKLVAALLGIYALLISASSMAQFDFFMSSTIYQNVRSWIFVIPLGAAVAYAAALGLESFARMAVPAAFLVLVTVLLLTGALAREVQPAYFYSPFYDGWGEIWEGAIMLVAHMAEFLPLILLFPRTGTQSPNKVFTGWLGCSMVVREWMILLVIATLGDYAALREFPLYGAASLAEVGPFGDLDTAHIVIWVIVGFLRISVYLYCGGICLRRIFPKGKLGLFSSLLAAASVGFSLWAFAYPQLSGGVDSTKIAGGFFLGGTVLLPFIIAMLPKARQKEGAV